jgi:hypothetical protein
MTRTELVNEISLRTGVEPAEARAVLDALLDLVRDGSVSPDILLFPRTPTASYSDPALVDDLIARARKHRFGIEFLRNGLLGSVAAEFGAHAFTVEAARQRLHNDEKDQLRGA